ncbi:FecR family protein [candidate division KSB1 bacterium]
MTNIPDDTILAGYLSGECSDADKAIVEQWLHEDPNNRILLDRLKKLWESGPENRVSWDKEKLWLKIAGKTGISASTENKIASTLPFLKGIFTSKFVRAAAVLLVFLLIPYIYRLTIGNPQNDSNIYAMLEEHVAYGEIKTVELPDGSKVTLDAGSELFYPETFEGDAREVQLNGEGYFDIKPDSEQPFIVHANNAVVKVLGTQFNLRAWPESEVVRLLVAEGKVAFRSSRYTEKDTVIVKRGQLSALYSDNRLIRPINVDIDSYPGWQERKFDFNDTALGEILSQIERWFNVEIILTESEYENIRLTIHMEYRPLDDVLGLIETLTKLQYTREGNTITFTKE